MKKQSLDLTHDGLEIRTSPKNYPIVLPIPTRPPASSFTMLSVATQNHSSTRRTACLSGVLPELFDSSLKPLPGKLIRPCDINFLNYREVPANSPSWREVACIENLRLIWRDGQLNLEFWGFPRDRQLRATFENLQAGEYLLRFKYCLPSGTKWKSTALETDFILIRLVELAEPTSVEVDGIQFEAIAPNQVVVPFSDNIETLTPIEFKLRIQNTSSAPHLFLLHCLIPALQDKSGQDLDCGYNRNGTYEPRETDFRLLQPGESLEFIIKGEFYWYKNQLYLRGYENSGGWWHHTIQEGKYWVSVTYHKRRWKQDPRWCEDGAWKLHQEIWEGWVSTPAKKLEVIRA
ncbi:hypothetical protein IQ250_14575 [Pseudanabaenaceae cyanobacterium LEGE 13415]|nr:hypothetical protein [Pseudanabaenaceae cyanobacterium LEGE 13415]